MKLLQKSVLLSIFLFTSVVAQAAGKVVVLDMDRALMSTTVMQAEFKKLAATAEFSALKAKFEGLQVDLKSLVKEAQDNNMTWSDADKQAQQIKAKAKQAEMRLAMQGLNAQKQAVMSKVMEGLGPKAKTALKQITVAEGIDVVISKKAAIWMAESADITDTLTARINKAK